MNDLKGWLSQIDIQQTRAPDQISDDFHLLLEAAQVAKLQLLAKLFEILEKIIRSTGGIKDFNHSVIAEALSILDIAWTLRNGLLSDGKESVLLSKLKLKERYMNSVRNAISIIKKAGH